MARVVILGAGLTGLSTAYHLEKNNFFDYKIFEKENRPGGLARSFKNNGFTFDFTGHLLHANDDYFKTFLKTITTPNTFNKLTRKSFIHSHNTYVPYPFQMNLNGLPHDVIKECIIGFVERSSRSSRSKKPFDKLRANGANLDNFYDWVIKYFGAGIGKHFFFPYNSKILATDIKKVHPSWTGRFVPKVTLDDILDGALQKRDVLSVGYNNTFLYPQKNGIQTIVDSMVQNITNPISFDCEATKIDLKNKCVQFKNGHVEQFETLITTLPLNNFLKNSTTPSNIVFKNAAEKLVCNSVINFNLGFDIANLTDKHWIYFPEKKFNFYRFGFWNNFSKNMTPKNCSSLYGEVSYLPKTKSKKQLETITNEAITQTCNVLNVPRANVIEKTILEIPHAYVIYNQWREKHLPKIQETLQKLSVYSIGRYGSWKYESMQEAILDGKKVSENIITQNALQTTFHPAIQTGAKVIKKIKRRKSSHEDSSNILQK